MAIGEAKAGIFSVTNNNFLDVRPVGINDEWILHNTYLLLLIKLGQNIISRNFNKGVIINGCNLYALDGGS